MGKYGIIVLWGNNVKVPFPLLPPADLKSPCEIFFAFGKETHMGKKSLIIPCHTDKRNLITICADVWWRNGDLYAFT